MKFSRETLIKIIKEEYERAEMEAENAENDPESPVKQLEWMEASMKKIRQAIENETKLDERMVKLLSTAAGMIDDIADKLTFNELVKQHVDDGFNSGEDED